MNELHTQVDDCNAAPSSVASYTAFEITVRLSKLRKTSTGSDGIPYLVLELCASKVGEVLDKLTNFSINEGVVPGEWKLPLATSISKTRKYKTLMIFGQYQQLCTVTIRRKISST
jgi:hypothetical protein